MIGVLLIINGQYILIMHFTVPNKKREKGEEIC